MSFYEKPREWKPDLTPVRLEITRPCLIECRRVEVGEVVTIARQDALQVVDLKRGRILDA